MPRQRVNHSREIYELPYAFPHRLMRFEGRWPSAHS